MNKEELEFEIEKQLDFLRELDDMDSGGIKEIMDELESIVSDGNDLVDELEDDEE